MFQIICYIYSMIYHITTIEDWEAQRHLTIFTDPSLQTKGFIHCSNGNQVAAIATALFLGRKDLIVISIDESQLSSRVVWENSGGAEEHFPHVYGPIQKEAIVSVDPLEPNSDGSFSFDPESLS